MRDQNRDNPKRVWSRAWLILGHFIGVLVLAAGLDLFVSGGVFWRVLTREELRQVVWSQSQVELWVHLGCATLFWVACISLWRLGFKRPTSQPALKVIKARARRGAVLLETLIVLVPFMALTGGLMQVTVNNIAGLLSNLAAYQAGRTVWLWSPEIGEDRSTGDVTVEKVTRMARLAAATSLAPVVPSVVKSGYSSSTKEVTEHRAAMFAYFSNSSVAPEGSTVSGQVNSKLTGGIEGSTKGSNFQVNLAFDASSMGGRGVRKLTFAAHPQVTEIELIRTPTQVGVTLTYHHYQAFPWFGYLVGSGGNKNIDGRTGYYLPIKRTYTLTPQVAPS